MSDSTHKPLDGRVAIVTGGARGIGAAIAEELIARGAKVCIADNGTSIDGVGAQPDVARQFAAQFGASALAFEESIASPGAAQKLVAAAVAKFGGLDIVVNNAAILRDAFIFKADPANWEAVIRTNLSAPFYLMAAASAHMREQGKQGRAGGNYDWGRIVNIVSSAGLYGNYGQAAYASAKAGLFGLTRVAALDLSRAAICVNAVAPFAATRVTDIIQPANEAQKTYKERALKIAPSHVAKLVAFLAGPSSAKISGQLFGVRGREIFLFSQPRPAAHIARNADWDDVTLGGAITNAFADKFTPLSTDLEAFNTEPIV